MKQYLQCSQCGRIYEAIPHEHGDQSPCCWDIGGRLERYDGEIVRWHNGDLYAAKIFREEDRHETN